MRSEDRKKQHERFLLERFLEAAKLQAEVTEAREAPDFIIRFEGRSIGVEITELFISHDTGRNLPQVQEALSSRIVSHAQQLYQASGARPAHVTVCFGPGCDLRSLNRDHTAAKLASFVQGLQLPEWQRVDWRPEELDGHLLDEISFVHALGVPKSKTAHWGVARAGWAAPLSAGALQSRIDEKTTRLLKYRNTVSENWLVVVADGTKPSQLFDAKAEFDSRTISSPFSRSFFYGHPDRAVIELGI
jgi:hypothetical protein